MTGMQRTTAAVIGLVVVVLAAVIGFLLFSSEEPPLADVLPSASESAEPSPSATLNAELLDRRWTVLYVGTDLNAAREEDGAGPNTDALMLVSLSADQSELTLVSLPRDTVDVPLPDGDTWTRKINGLYVERGMRSWSAPWRRCMAYRSTRTSSSTWMTSHGWSTRPAASRSPRPNRSSTRS